MKKSLIVGLTGGICSGKTTVANLFGKLGVEIIDADQIAKKIINKNIILDKLLSRWGYKILNINNNKYKNINRLALRNIILNSKTEKNWLDGLLHPLIRVGINNRLFNINSNFYNKFNYKILVIPLLIENRPYPFIDRILLVDSCEELQLMRLMQRDHCAIDQAKKFLKLQIDRLTRRCWADELIENNFNFKKLSYDVIKLHRYYNYLSQ